MPNVHVTPKGERWQVKLANANNPLKTFPTQQKAFDYGRKEAKNNNSELFLHRKDGTIRERNTYGKDNFPPRG